MTLGAGAIISLTSTVCSSGADGHSAVIPGQGAEDGSGCQKLPAGTSSHKISLFSSKCNILGPHQGSGLGFQETKYPVAERSTCSLLVGEKGKMQWEFAGSSGYDSDEWMEDKRWRHSGACTLTPVCDLLALILCSRVRIYVFTHTND